ncbi:MAG: nitrous oxide-stimulated promoter family protein [Bacillus sp. (in: firmicutes)]
MNRMKRERQTISLMISLYCKSEHKQNELCEECQKLKDYAFFRLEKCPFQEKKPACQNCKIHCYKPDMRQQVKEVMRKSGPKVLVHNPYYAIMHLIDNFRKAPDLPKRNRQKNSN